MRYTVSHGLRMVNSTIVANYISALSVPIMSFSIFHVPEPITIFDILARVSTILTQVSAILLVSATYVILRKITSAMRDQRENREHKLTLRIHEDRHQY